MNISNFFIKRPIFAAVISIVIFVIGTLAYFRLPLSEYPEVVPPTVVVRTSYPGANPTVIADTVASPLEQQINGVEGMLYMFSQATADGVMTLTITFGLGTDLDKAQVQVQNRVSQALPRLPQEVQRLGVTTEKTSPDLLMVVHLESPDNRYDTLYLANLAILQVKDELGRLPGVGNVQVFGAGDFSMRVWLNPNKLASHNLTATDVVQAIREQNVQVAAGVLGAPPTNTGSTAFQLLVNTQGRLTTEEEFGNIIVRAAKDGQITRIRDLGRVELGSSTYALRSLLDNKPAAALPISQRPGSNALQTSQLVRETMERLKKSFPVGVDYKIVYDPTVFVRESIQAVGHTFVEALILVVIVVLVFLQTWRASIIPLLALPVSLVGTFSIMLALGFSLNTLSLFGLVLAIGIVVDDAIVVVENVERNIALGHEPHEATRRAMEEVSGPIVAIALVLCAVFVPTAFIVGLSGQFYKQFALTIAISTVISAFNSLTLSPALAALLLKPHGAKKDRLTRAIDFALGWFFKLFNRFFGRASGGYGKFVTHTLRSSVIAVVVYAGLVGLTILGFSRVPTGFVPTQDKGYLVSFAQLPNGATLDRTDDVIRNMSDIALKHPGVQNAVAFPGLSINGFTNSPNSGIVFAILKPSEERKSPELSANAIAANLNKQYGSIQEAFIAIFPPPPVQGLGTVAGFKLYIEDRAGMGLESLYKETTSTLQKGNQTPGLAGVFSSFDINVPQIDSHVDREKAKTYGIPLGDLFDTMQVYLGSLYVNDFNRFGRTYQVNVQAESSYRLQPEDISHLRTRNLTGEMIPLGSVITVEPIYGPDRVMHYNGFPAAEINGAAASGYSTGQSEGAIAKLLDDQLPTGMKYEWTELTYQKILAGNTMVYIFPLSVLLVYLVLAAQYESWSLPLVIILIVPMTLFSAIVGVWLLNGDNNVFTQISLIVLVGLACKNAILIVEFAREKQLQEGMNRVDAVLEACRLRLRPILMTSLAFTMGVVPLVLSSGAGSEMRRAIGVAVFFGMLGVTAFGLVLTPVFYVVIQRFVEGREIKKSAASAGLSPSPSVEA
ncbi:MAG TPA: multidrug efflux RND transporter permease subunit [Candidatus Dormibacteraeota bacterium]|nr:multidrug efflux RND transporter permease subunit [Candidatus Dormibacteraeota bacterium]